MKKFTSVALATLMALSAAIPVTTTSAEARNRGAKIAGGVILGAAALAIIANSNRANASGYNNGYRNGRSNGFWATCNKWYRQCDRGNNYACEKYETRGCTE